MSTETGKNSPFERAAFSYINACASGGGGECEKMGFCPYDSTFLPLLKRLFYAKIYMKRMGMGEE